MCFPSISIYVCLNALLGSLSAERSMTVDLPPHSTQLLPCYFAASSCDADVCWILHSCGVAKWHGIGDGWNCCVSVANTILELLGPTLRCDIVDVSYIVNVLYW